MADHGQESLCGDEAGQHAQCVRKAIGGAAYLEGIDFSRDREPKRPCKEKPTPLPSSKNCISITDEEIEGDAVTS